MRPPEASCGEVGHVRPDSLYHGPIEDFYVPDNEFGPYISDGDQSMEDFKPEDHEDIGTNPELEGYSPAFNDSMLEPIAHNDFEMSDNMSYFDGGMDQSAGDYYNNEPDTTVSLFVTPL